MSFPETLYCVTRLATSDDRKRADAAAIVERIEASETSAHRAAIRLFLEYADATDLPEGTTKEDLLQIMRSIDSMTLEELRTTLHDLNKNGFREPQYTMMPWGSRVYVTALALLPGGGWLRQAKPRDHASVGYMPPAKRNILEPADSDAKRARKEKTVADE